MATPLKTIVSSDDLAQTMRDIGGSSMFDGPSAAQRHFDALKRMLDRKEPDYAE